MNQRERARDFSEVATFPALHRFIVSLAHSVVDSGVLKFLPHSCRWACVAELGVRVGKSLGRVLVLREIIIECLQVAAQ